MNEFMCPHWAMVKARSSTRKAMAAQVMKDLCDSDELKNANCKGEKNKDAICTDKLNYTNLLVFHHFPSADKDDKKVGHVEWRECEINIDTSLRNLRKKAKLQKSGALP